ncbi:16S rRNA (cytosine(967)-C(5))-methyltransferase RsmB [Agrilactobacillus fermenti]|uniref:16S rRNA (cytosine(967)-C(5))-methyltransferase RsmB n=1 Tax=Agrilactobacillus fermenti TaxID=2586909 RepID=UPI002E7ADE8B|nr:16S rRNA (cytosine(967)-C(5))-methyltransferase RsmB [Agrilactobacillus fermenti]MCD2256221.1 16S rRNA (cytosine(967)-C(5))-methyltransferase RsmB [Agrilactobacillus fermenti]
MNQSARKLAIEILLSVLKKQAYSNIELDQAIKHHALKPQDRHLLTNIVYGVLQQKYLLDFQLAPFIKKPQKMDDWVQILLETAVYQMKYLTRIPIRAVIYESVQIAKRRGHQGVAKLVNAILRNVQRQGWRDLADIQDQWARLSIEYSIPVSLIHQLNQDLGSEKTVQILTSINTVPKISLRVNEVVISRKELQEALLDVDIHTTESVISPQGLITTTGVSELTQTELFKTGAFTFQDESAQLVVPALQVQPGDQVLDACAAPGGKTMQIAANLSASAGGQVTALDLYEHKVKLIQQNVQRMHLNSVVKTRLLDATTADTKFLEETFDRILVDAPCSGIGLLRRKPEIRYRKELTDFVNLKKVQLQILNSVAKTLKRGGTMVYSTCTIIKQENEMVVENFLKHHSDFELTKTYSTVALKSKSNEKSLHIYPDDYHSDGFFIATLKRKS